MTGSHKAGLEPTESLNLTSHELGGLIPSCKVPIIFAYPVHFFSSA